MKKIFLILSLALLTYFIYHLSYASDAQSGKAAFSLGLLIVIGFLFGRIAEKIHLSHITGYILSGIVCGPYLLGFISFDSMLLLQPIDHLALALIAFTAGGALRLKNVKKSLRTILTLTTSQIIIHFFGASLLTLLGLHFFHPLGQLPLFTSLSIAILFGVIATANSPAATVAVIVETKSKGRLTDIVLGVTVIKDVLVLLLFVFCMALAKSLNSGQAIELGELSHELLNMIASLFAGGVIAILVSLYLRFIRRELVLFVLGLSVFIVYFTELLHLHFLLTCLSAGFLVENFTPWGEDFITAVERGSLWVYIMFFSLAGASINLVAMQEYWHIALFLVLIRLLVTFFGTFVGTKLSGEDVFIRRFSWLGFIGQAGVSIGMVLLVSQAFQEWGGTFKTICIAAIAVNEIIGPACLKFLLEYAGETAQMRLKRHLAQLEQKRG
ncbi:MAG: hypothetical protein COX62_01260 [Deltaproteobacteria bacterium CG_4_10_14_0_2_um_filter_43_8]|nr:MAG: hypothetical protein COV43_09400 [Deltaproteobacteria bacterium CG11_big_fil_rev_8_21_14_0_20_42_23]PJA21873.1 MAG: hypothetical protein COX62_01260 [Deltaproteobacteria bacterium CG_4_10_14_0_2_um_filter_43_8]PJC64363.1 MAG: hypothetical protein CO021_05005 [Deltaproteobacteria bacterium CG_4_9_14_0_2_um_filter_42_21]